MLIHRSIDNMADHDSIVSSDKLEAIADAIREKTHKDNLMTLDEMPDEIASISGGGGATPECGVVPTSWSSNGFVLSADSYGNIFPGFFYAGWQNVSQYGYPYDTHDPNLPEDIGISELDDAFLGTQVYNYLKSLTFVTAPAVIGHEAFSDLYWLEIDELPEGIEVIEDSAFYQCYNLQLHTIPSTVTSIGNNAFQNTNHPERFIVPYSEEATYSIGDITMLWNYGEILYYTCIVDIDTPEEFNSDHWVTGIYPEMLGIYDSSISYPDGTIVCTVHPITGNEVCTCTNIDSPNRYISGNYPEILGEWDPNTIYHKGDVVMDVYNVFTCIQTAHGNGPYDTNYWYAGYCPEIVGRYDSTQTYSIGDVVIAGSDEGYYVDTIVTCCDTISSPEQFNLEHWADGYYPNILGIYDSSQTYHTGDLIAETRYMSLCEVCTYFTEDEYICPGAYPDIIGEYDSTRAYSVGDIVYTSISSTGADCYTCYKNAPVGVDIDNTDYWIPNYVENMSGEYDSDISYNRGTVLYDDGNVITILYPKGLQTRLAAGYYPDLIGQFDSTHTYYAGDIVNTAVYGSDYDSFYMCISPTAVTGEWDDDKWEDITGESADPTFKVQKLEFLGTPNSIGYDAFADTDYNLVLAPWEEGEGPTIDLGARKFVVYGYQAPDQNT